MINFILSTYIKNRRIVLRAYPWSFVFGRLIGGVSSIIIPFLIFSFLFDKQVSALFLSITDSSDYMTYVTLGAIVNTLGMAMLMNIGRAFITELREGTIEVFLISPASRVGYFIGCLAEQTGRAIFEMLIIGFLGMLLGANLMGVVSFSALIALLFIAGGFFSMTILLSSVMLYTRDTYITQNTLFHILNLITGVTFPIEYLPRSIQIFSQIIPMTHSLKLFRAIVINHETISDNVFTVAAIFVLSIIYFLVGIVWAKKIEKRLVEEIFG